MTREQWVGRVKRVVEGLNKEVGVKIVVPKQVMFNGTAARVLFSIGGCECTFLYGYDLHAGRADQFWLDVIWEASYGIESLTFCERELMGESSDMVEEIMSSIIG